MDDKMKKEEGGKEPALKEDGRKAKETREDSKEQ